MRITEAQNFFTQANQTETRTRIKNLPALTPNKNLDSVSISDVAKRLSANLQKSSSVEKTSKAEQVGPVSQAGKRIDNIMKKAVDILERMQDLTRLAQDDQLTDQDRIEIQIEIEDLRDNFDVLPRNLITDENNFSRMDVDRKFDPFFDGDADGSSLLERMRMRINNGDEWDVREAYSPEGFVRITHDEDGEEVYEVGDPGWHVVDDSKVTTQDSKTGEIFESSKSVPTVRERLEAMTPYVVMDAESAEKAEALIQNHIDAIQKWRENLPELEKQLNDNKSLKAEAFLFLENIAFPGGVHESSPLAPDKANYFYNGAKIYDKIDLIEGIVTDDSGENIQPYGTEIAFSDNERESPVNVLDFGSVKLSDKVLPGLEKGRDESPLMGLVPPDAGNVKILESLHK